MKLYLLIQSQYQEEDFGSLTIADSIIHGVFTDIILARSIAKNIPEPIFTAQYGEAKETLYLLEIESNTKIEELKYANNLL